MNFLVVCLSLMFASSSVFAAEARRPSAAPAAAAPVFHSSGLTAVGVADTTMVTNGESLSAMFSNGQDWIQALLGVYQTKGNFNFAVGGAYKFTLAGSRSNGFHLGPGFTLGTVADDFAFAIFGAAGGHFTVADHLIFSVDAGPMVTHTKDNTNFRLRPLGQLLGIAAHYVF